MRALRWILGLLLSCLPLTVLPAHADNTIQRTDLRVPVSAEPDGTPVELDASWHSARGEGPRPVLVLTHGFGGSKQDLTGQATDFAERGYLVITYTARGFDASGGRIHLNDPDFEVADLRAIVGLAATLPGVQLDAPGDPRLGVTGASYGGAVALMAAATDPRIDVIAPIATWHDLGAALFPNHGALSGQPGTDQRGTDQPGPLQQQWIAGFFAASQRPSPGLIPGGDPVCGRFDPVVCADLLDAGRTGRATPGLMAELRRRSPAATDAEVRVPTLLVQGLADSLFGLDQADATAAALARAGTPFAVHWTDGGHDAEASNPGADQAAVLAWFDTHLRGGTPTVPVFRYPGPRPFGDGVADTFTADRYPGLANPAAGPVVLALDDPAAGVLTPPGGQPASLTRAIPFGGTNNGSSNNNTLQAYPLAALPGQSAAFDTGTVESKAEIVGAPKVRLRVTSTANEVTLFVSLWQVNGATAAQPRRGVAPVRVPVVPGVPTEVEVTLPAGTWVLEPGSTWRILVTSTDQAYANSTLGRVDRVEMASGLVLPTFTGTPAPADLPVDPELVGVLIALAAAVLAFALWALRYHRQRARLPERAEYAGVPVVVEDLVKSYPDGHRAVDGVSWRAEAGQVVGLLGPNGAGKTTTLRMVLGLIRPDSGGSWVLGRPVAPGADVLRRVGALVEGPGFQPHLTGRQNLRAYWAATGRPQEEAGFAEAIEVAALSDALDRPVKAYSHGMKQRLGIAQAMLGRPELLILDEPTNGLDPPQIAAMRPILRAYAATGRTVVISSHLLAEVEQTCTHVVVMDAGKVLIAGPVGELLESRDTTVLATAVPVRDQQLAALRAVPGVVAVVVEEDTRVVVEAEVPRAEVVRAAVAAGLELIEVSGRRHLEELFLDVIGQGRAPRARSGQTLADRLREVRPR